VIVFDVIGMPGCTGVLTESAEVPVAVAEYTLPATHGASKNCAESVTWPLAGTLMLVNCRKAPFL